MCFSATASFTASAFLIPTGFFCLNKARKLDRTYLPIATLPLLFGIQQVFEGSLWLTLSSANQEFIRPMALGFLFFSLFFWLFWVPLSGYLLEKERHRKKIIKAFAIVGCLYGASLYFPLLTHYTNFTIPLINGSLGYQIEFIYDPFIPKKLLRVIYAILILVPLLISSNRYIKYFAILIFASALFSTVIYNQTFISVWCYFASIISLYIVYMIYKQSQPTLE